MTYIKLLLIGLIVFASTNYTTGQNLDDNEEDVVYLKNGTILRGMILALNSKRVQIRTNGGNLVTHPMSEVEKITREESEVVRIKKSRPFMTKGDGVYHMLSAGFLPGRNSMGQFDFGTSIHWTSGYQWNQWLGLGLGVEINSFQFPDKEIRIILQAEKLLRFTTDFYSAVDT